MGKVKNSPVIRRLALRILLAKKKKNFIAVLAIVLTAVLFTALFVVGGSIVEITQEQTMRQVGTSAHIGFKYMMPQDWEVVKEDSKIADCSYNIMAGFARNEALSGLQCEVRYFEEKDAKWSFSYPTTGKMPEKFNEIALSTIVLDALGLPHEVGTAVPMEIEIQGNTKSYEFILSGFWEGDRAANAQECLVSRSFCQQEVDVPTVSWTQKQQESVEAVSPDGYWSISVYFSNSWNLEEKADQLVERCGFDPDTTNVGINWAYGFSGVDTESLILVGGLLLLITFSGYLIIYNIFYINIYSDIRFYGLLKTIGTTGRQLRKIVRRQAMILCVVGIPLGLLLGYGIGYGIVPVALSTTELSEMTYQVSASPWIFVGAAAFTLFTVSISSILPCRIASRISPVEAVRYTEPGSKKTAKRKKTRKVTPRQMAAGNLKRNKKRFVVTVLSLSLSLILFNTVYTMVRGFSLEKFLENQVAGDLSVTWTGVERPGSVSGYLNYDVIPPELKETLEQMQGVESVASVYCRDYNHLNVPDEQWQRIQAIIDQDPNLQDPVFAQSIALMESERTYNSRIYAVDESLWEDLEIQEGTLDPEKFASGNYIIVNQDTFEKDGQEMSLPYYEIGDTVKLELPAGEEGEQTVTKEYEVLAIGSLSYAMGAKSSGLIDEEFILPSRAFLELAGADYRPLRLILEVEEGAQEQVEQWLTQYCDNVNPDLILMSRAVYEKEFENLKNTFLVIGGLLSFILGLIGILNFINACVTSILARKQELAMMEAVGMTGRQLREMLQWEGAGYAIVTVLLCLTVGMAASYGGVHLLAEQMSFFQYHFTLLPILVSMPLLLLIAVLVPTISYRFSSRVSVVDRIRSVE